ncbi:hypothetical protein C8R47DRAFT_1125672 [Mycena vitilis]|nr:hypothetical protein C8R47DRAFT_1125672 [Mycena vitilis]
MGATKISLLKCTLSPQFLLSFFLRLSSSCGPWKKLAARRGAVIKYWHSTPTNPNNPYR